MTRARGEGLLGSMANSIPVLLGAFWLSLFSAAIAAEGKVKLGAPAPELSAKSDSGETIRLSEIYSKGDTLIYFYPRADTPGCTAQACSLRDAFTQLQKKNLTVIGVSTDDVPAQKAFKKKFHLPFTLLADTDGKIAEAFGVPVQGGFASRQAFLIRKGRFHWIDRNASTQQQAQDVLKVIEKQ